MFSSAKRLKDHTGPKDLNRFDYLQALVTEFQDTTNLEDKKQVLANLANFAYDPINYDYLRQLQVIELFIDCITEDEDLNGSIVEFGIGGLCNLVPDPKNREIAIEVENSIDLVKRCLLSANTETVLSAMTTLMLLITPENKNHVVSGDLIANLNMFSNSENVRIKTLANLFLCDYIKQKQ